MTKDYAAPDWRGLCEELVEAAEHHVSPYAGHHSAWEAAVDRARAALAQPEPEVVGPSDGEPPPGPFSEHDLRQQWNQQADEFNQWDSLDSSEQLAWAQVRAIAADRARRPAPAPAGEVAELNDAINVIESVAGFTDADTAVGEAWAVVLARLKPAPAPAGEVGEALKVIDKMQQEWVLISDNDGTASPSLTMPISLRRFTVIRDALTRAADLLERQAAPVPVAVSERLPGAGDCDADGFCWWFSPADPSAGTFGVAACWVLRKYEPEDDFRTHWLPAHALPLPSGEVES